MSMTEILEELSKLNPEELGEVHRWLFEREEQDLGCGADPTDAEKAILDQTWDDFEKSGEVPMPCREFMDSLDRKKSQ